MDRRLFLQGTVSLGLCGLFQTGLVSAEAGRGDLVGEDILLRRSQPTWKGEAPERCLLSIVNRGPGVVQLRAVAPVSSTNKPSVVRVWPGFSLDIDVDKGYPYQIELVKPDATFWWRLFHDSEPKNPNNNYDGVWSFVDIIKDRVEEQTSWFLPRCEYKDKPGADPYFPGFRPYINLSLKTERFFTFHNLGPGKVELHSSTIKCADETIPVGGSSSQMFRSGQKCHLRKVTERTFAKGWFMAHACKL